MKWHWRIHRRPKTAHVRHVEGLHVLGIEKSEKLSKTLNEVVPEDMMDCGVTENMAANGVEWKNRIHKAEPNGWGKASMKGVVVGAVALFVLARICSVTYRYNNGSFYTEKKNVERYQRVESSEMEIC